MSSLAILLVLGSAILHAVRDYLTKRSADKQIFIWWVTVVSLLVSTPIVLYITLAYGAPPWQGVAIALGASLIHFSYWMFQTKAYEKGDLSHVYPIMRSSPALVLLFAIVFLQEKVSALGVCGILLVTAGVYMINIKAFNLKALLEPIASIRQEKHVLFAFGALISTVLFSLTDKVGVSMVHPFVYAFAITLFAFIPFSFYLFKAKNHSIIKNTWGNNKNTIVLQSIIATTSYPLILTAFTLSQVSYIVGLRQISVIFAVIIGGQILKEKYLAMRLTASFLIFSGAIMIAMG